MSKTPKVSIVSITYNQEKYIQEALDSFVMQQTDFDFEIVIADDCSTDRTPEIIRSYAEKHPDIFRPILRKKNIGIQKNIYDALKKARGEYIALCEGDDYWTDSKKLQKQTDFLDANPECGLCFHPVRVFFENSEQKEYVYPAETRKKDFSVKNLLKENFIQTNAVMYRKQKYENMPSDILPLDWYLHLYHAQFGKIGFLNEVMSAYRRHPGGVWWEATTGDDALWEKHGQSHVRLFVAVMKLYPKNEEYRKIIIRHVAAMLPKLIQVDSKRNSRLLHEVLKEFSNDTETLIIALEENKESVSRAQKFHMEEQLKVIEHLTSERDDLQRRFDHSMQELDKVNKEYERVRKSVAWRAMNRLPTRKRNKQA